MTITTRAVRLPASASNTTQDFTVAGFGTPTAVMFLYSYGTTNDTDTDHALIGQGFYDGTNMACGYGHSLDNVISTSTTRVRNAVRNDAVVNYYDGVAATTRSATAAFITDGVRLTWTGTTSMQPYVTAILIKGASAAVGVLTSNAVLDGTAAVSGLGFDPDLLFMFAPNNATVNTTNSQNMQFVTGVAAKGNIPPTQKCVSYRDFGSGATTSIGIGVFSAAASGFIGGSSFAARTEYQVTSFDTGGFTIKTAITAATARPLAYLALGTGLDADVFSVSAPTSAGNWSPTLSTATPEAVFMWTTALGAVDTIDTSGNGAEGIGFWYANSSSENFGAWVSNDDAVGTSDTKTQVTSSIKMLDATARTTLFQANPGTSNANLTWTGTGFTLASAGVTPASTGYQLIGVAFHGLTTTRKLKLLAVSSAASASGIAGVVFNAPTGGDITGSKIGEFTGKTFQASLEGGQAVLKVPVSDFGGGSLTPSDEPVALVRNTTDTTGIVSCTVIDE